ncbi:unnamed protein product [Phaedon cochleariae]|uniref:Glutathione synthetase n=1 Tax=Phaedon cochleariae TaxID=80249 RepID=A0A9N9SHL2_PHACE|nr:unnamed protein product [Phaedon cochleariae]
MCSVPCTPSSVLLPLQENKLRELVRNAKDWAIMHGACMRSRSNFSEDTINFAPFTLFPTTFPREQFQKAVDIQTVFLELIHKVAHDGAFLRECLKDTIKVDDFTANLFRIYETIEKEGRAQVSPRNMGVIF